MPIVSACSGDDEQVCESTGEEDCLANPNAQRSLGRHHDRTSSQAFVVSPARGDLVRHLGDNSPVSPVPSPMCRDLAQHIGDTSPVLLSTPERDKYGKNEQAFGALLPGDNSPVSLNNRELVDTCRI
jgi:hypothetical protein